jgi:hypothetical protein
VSWSWTRDIWLSLSKLFVCTLSKSKFVPEKDQNISAGIDVCVYNEIKFCGMLCCVTWQVVNNVSMEYSAFIFRVEQSKQTGLLYAEDEGITNHQKSVTTYH